MRIQTPTKAAAQQRNKHPLPIFGETPSAMIPRVQLGSFIRSLSTSASPVTAPVKIHRTNVSHIGRKPIPVPPAVTLTVTPESIAVQGPLGTTAVPLREYMKLSYPEPSFLSIEVENSAVKEQRAMWGLTRTLISNAITGMTEGFTLPVYLVGVGFRVALEEDPRGTSFGGNGQRLNMKLGYSHPVYEPIPPHIRVEVPTATKIVVFCTDKHQLGLFCAKLRNYRKPEPYKGKVRCNIHICHSWAYMLSRASLLGRKLLESRLSRRSRLP